MLIVHPSSSCDICLDAYDWDIPTQMPHAIPCGHIFCKTCPFCRKPFVGSRIVKLHVDRPASSEQGVEDVELLRRLDAEEAKRQAELEAAVEQSKQRKRALRESLERAHRLQEQREEEAEARKRQSPTVAGKSAFGAVPSPRDTETGLPEMEVGSSLDFRQFRLGTGTPLHDYQAHTLYTSYLIYHYIVYFNDLRLDDWLRNPLVIFESLMLPKGFKEDATIFQDILRYTLHR
ncbi:uncharacterized protein LACBIDRAFT_293759 [Laccaria bicolor S238N-H82]|uniref:Predicted protein n=1 Tax=Laccaria bicolor (strain S238N-H82 / ATCC MYA-4686) TaxID=486041 RepID=B0D6D1_LACBS|nr:uncharacterized protein LACBIDRAFT_293759 [Laccaria bicolor S238N-H82]EDR09929.1 predicted protein [Laccaria bicolor S238N-H82]|eukprot:XP_001879314.1 predicted protein [Laccaria bicolor S238N-H82]